MAKTKRFDQELFDQLLPDQPLFDQLDAAPVCSATRAFAPSPAASSTGRLCRI